MQFFFVHPIEAGGQQTSDITAVCSDSLHALGIKAAHNGYAAIQERKAVVFDYDTSKDRAVKVLLLDDIEEDTPFTLNVDLDQEQEQLKKSALAKLSPQELEALKERGLD